MTDYTALRNYYNYLFDEDMNLKRQTIENQMRLLEREKVSRELSREVERQQAVVSHSAGLKYETEEFINLQNEQLAQIKINFKELAQFYELEMQKFEQLSNEKAKELLNLEILPMEMSKLLECVQSDTLVLLEEQKIQKCIFEQEKKCKSFDTVSILDDDSRLAFKIFTEKFNTLLQ